ncbi:conjugal transfer protein TraF [Vibrio ziniensis]|uniref:Conjugal transfer protein TraF n=1 Tax=Vibrio ziniensis TaxID=2711221 RepID=A0A6G7CJU4_9VIBR|nr:conjugal transfer protein TraF [Vibrio ziniensis]QIH42340.1 conjugal transfer protein TraF [Vibrio ziniensis]
MKRNSLLAVGALTVVSTSSIAAPYVADARSQAMGNTGVVSADYLTAPLHNPALGAMYKDNDDFGILLPAIGANINDQDDSFTLIDDLDSTYSDLENNINDYTNSPNSQSESDAIANARKLQSGLNSLADNAPMTVNAGLSAVIAIPTSYISVNLFTTGYVEALVRPEIDVVEGEPSTVEEAADVLSAYDNSQVHLVAFGVTEFGISFARQFQIFEQNFSFGFAPKYQYLVTYSQLVTLEDFELDDYDQSEISKTAFNMDLGAVWYKDAFRVGLSVKDVFKQEIETEIGGYTYELSPKATLGLGYAGDFFALSLDADLTTQKRFKEFDTDDSQFVRVGVEANAWGWAQLRAGYEMDLKDNLQNSITAGIGISPFDVVSLDIAGSYAGENQFGAAANLAFTF